ncbi:hypothetical protein ACVWXL_000564 [Bradyrhizobium sp. GM22.5]
MEAALGDKLGEKPGLFRQEEAVNTILDNGKVESFRQFGDAQPAG